MERSPFDIYACIDMVLRRNRALKKEQSPRVQKKYKQIQHYRKTFMYTYRGKYRNWTLVKVTVNPQGLS